jgi:hypothetical protein
LKDLFQATDEPQWKHHRGWLVSTTVSEWFGVSCTDGYVTSTSMNHVDIGSRIPPSFGTLTHFEVLNLYYNEISGGIPPELGKLEGLKLRSNKSSGGLPADLGNLDRLQGLWLSTNGFSGVIPTEWSGMTSLSLCASYGNDDLGPLPPFLASQPPDGYPGWANPNVP